MSKITVILALIGHLLGVNKIPKKNRAELPSLPNTVIATNVFAAKVGEHIYSSSSLRFVKISESHWRRTELDTNLYILDSGEQNPKHPRFVVDKNTVSR